MATFGTQTASGQNTIPSTQQGISINLTAPTQVNGSSITISGFVSREAITTDLFNIAYVIDTSGSMDSNFSGNETVADYNGDGSSNELIDGAILAYDTLTRNLVNAGLANSQVSIIDFSRSVSTIYTGAVGQDNDANTILDVNESLGTLRDGGSTNFEAALQESIEFFEKQANNASNFVFFISDGEPTSGGRYTDEVATLLDTHNATIRALGLGYGADINELDFIDDGINNNSAERVLTPSQLTTSLTASSVNAADIDRVEIYVNSTLQQVVSSDQLESTALGLKYNVNLNSLVIGQDDIVEARVVANDTVSTYATAALTIGESNTTGGVNNDSIGRSQTIVTLNDNATFTLLEQAQVFGSNGYETVRIAGTPNVTIDSSVERLEFVKTFNEYGFFVTDNILSVVDRDVGSVVANITSYGESLHLAFQDGSTQFSLTGLNQGVMENKTNIFEQFNKHELNQFLSSPSANILNTTDISSTSFQTFGSFVTHGESVLIELGSSLNYNATNNQVSYVFSDSIIGASSVHANDIAYTIANFGVDDTLAFSANGTDRTISVVNSNAFDGELFIHYDHTTIGHSVTVKLTGIDAQTDLLVNDVESFNTIFGIGSLY